LTGSSERVPGIARGLSANGLASLKRSESKALFTSSAYWQKRVIKVTLGAVADSLRARMTLSSKIKLFLSAFRA